jgi:hypothetical protein
MRWSVPVVAGGAGLRMTQFDLVGAWDAGPFDNDDAADFGQELDEADPNQRLVLIRQALEAVVDAESEDEDELDEAQPRAVAAAAVLAANRLEAPAADSAYAPKFLASGDPLDASDDLLELAVLALDRVAESETEWADLFGEAGTLEALRDALTG